MAGKSRQEELDAAGRITPPVRSREQGMLRMLRLFSLLYPLTCPESQPQSGTTHREQVFPPT